MQPLLLGVSTLLQFTAAVFALRLMKVTGRRRAWVFIALGISILMLLGIWLIAPLFRSIQKNEADLARANNRFRQVAEGTLDVFLGGRGGCPSGMALPHDAGLTSRRRCRLGRPHRRGGSGSNRPREG